MHEKSVLMEGFVDLVFPANEDEFVAAFRAFADHLIDAGFLGRWFVGFRQSHSGYNVAAPEHGALVGMEFTDLDQANFCWDYVVKDDEPVKSYHKGIKCLTHSEFRFFLTRIAAVSSTSK